MTNIISKPTWLYKTVSIPRLDLIQTEFLKIYRWMYIDAFTDAAFGPYSSRYVGINKDVVNRYAPAFVQTLKDLNLYERWDYVSFAGTKNYSTKQSNIHVDDVDWQNLSFSLNLPILNCHDSWTVWYDIEPDEGSTGLEQAVEYPRVIGYPESKVKGEIGRISVTESAFINVSAPHRPVTNHDDLRLILTTRFHPDLFDYDFNLLNFAVNR